MHIDETTYKHVIDDLQINLETVLTAIYNLGAIDIAIEVYDTGLPVPTAVAEEAALSGDGNRRLIAAMGAAITPETRAALEKDSDGWVRFFAKFGSRKTAFF